MNKDQSKNCKCGCHTGGTIHFMECSCYRGKPVLDKPVSLDERSENAKLLSKFVEYGVLKEYSIKKVYEEPGVEMRTSEEITLVFPQGHTLTINTMCSGSSENVDLILKAGSALTGK